MVQALDVSSVHNLSSFDLVVIVGHMMLVILIVMYPIDRTCLDQISVMKTPRLCYKNIKLCILVSVFKINAKKIVLAMKQQMMLV